MGTSVASLRLEVQVPCTIALNFRFFQVKALKVSPGLGWFGFKAGPLLSTFFNSRP